MMKTRIRSGNLIIVYLLSFILFTIFGCSKINPIATQVINNATEMTNYPTIMKRPTNTKVISSHDSNITSEPIDILTQTPTLISTLTDIESYELQNKLFSEDTGCHLPCWWGITPKMSEWNKTKKFLESAGLSISNGYDTGNDSMVYMVLGLQVGTSRGILDNHMSFLIKDDLVEGIYFSSDAIDAEVEFQNLLQNYSPDRILEDYGIPSRVLLESRSSGPSGHGRIAGYELWLFYDEIDFLIRYHGFSEFEPVYRICPGFNQDERMYSIQIYIQSPSNPDSIESMAEKFDLDIPVYPYIQTIEESAGLSLVEFYELFMDDSQEACFDTPQEIWP